MSSSSAAPSPVRSTRHRCRRTCRRRQKKSQSLRSRRPRQAPPSSTCMPWREKAGVQVGGGDRGGLARGGSALDAPHGGAQRRGGAAAGQRWLRTIAMARAVSLAMTPKVEVVTKRSLRLEVGASSGTYFDHQSVGERHGNGKSSTRTAPLPEIRRRYGACDRGLGPGLAQSACISRRTAAMPGVLP